MSKIDRSELLALLQNAIVMAPPIDPVLPKKSKKKLLSVEEAVPDDYFKNKKVVFTGGLVEMTKEEAGAFVEQLGGTISKTVTKDTDALVVAAEVIESGKLDKANQLGIKIIKELEFMQILQSNGLIPVST